MALYTRSFIEKAVAGAAAIGSTGYVLKYFNDEHVKTKTKEFNDLMEKYNFVCDQLEHVRKDAALNRAEAQNNISKLEAANNNSKKIIDEKQKYIDKLETVLLDMKFNKNTDDDGMVLTVLIGCATLLGIAVVNSPLIRLS